MRITNAAARPADASTTFATVCAVVFVTADQLRREPDDPRGVVVSDGVLRIGSVPLLKLGPDAAVVDGELPVMLLVVSRT